LALSLLLIWLVIGHPTGTLWDVAIDIRKQDLVSHLLLTQDVFGTGRINYAFWSIATEWQIYFFFPLLVWSWRSNGPRVTVAAALTAAYGIALAVAGTRGARAHAQFLGLFTLGMLGAAICHGRDAALERLRERVPWAALGVTCASLLAACVLYWGWAEAIRHFVALDGPVAVLALCLLVLASRSERNPVRAVFSWAPLPVVGAFSYSLYLIHAPLLQLIWQYGLHPAGIGQEAQFAVLVCLGLPAILGASYLFHLGLERPFIGASGGQRPSAGTALMPSP
jgi:peptidoglycan/LPS O-acetylase OafA/YrhL